jgi:hypothetical protein
MHACVRVWAFQMFIETNCEKSAVQFWNYCCACVHVSVCAFQTFIVANTNLKQFAVQVWNNLLLGRQQRLHACALLQKTHVISKKKTRM